MNSKVNSSRMTFAQATLLLSSFWCAVAQFSINNPNTGKSYAVFSSCANYLTAKGTCEDEPNTHLIHLETETEQEWLYQQLVSAGLPTRFWIGLEMANGMWTWVDSLTSTPIQGSHRISGYNSYGPKYCLADGDINWIQMHNANCFPYVCEHSTPVTTTSTEPTTTTATTTSTPMSTGGSTDMMLCRRQYSRWTEVVDKTIDTVTSTPTLTVNATSSVSCLSKCSAHSLVYTATFNALKNTCNCFSVWTNVASDAETRIWERKLLVSVTGMDFESCVLE